MKNSKKEEFTFPNSFSNTLWIGQLADSEDPDEMSENAAFHETFHFIPEHCLLREKEIHYIDQYYVVKCVTLHHIKF